jgi:hypothetical protein
MLSESGANMPWPHPFVSKGRVKKSKPTIPISDHPSAFLFDRICLGFRIYCAGVDRSTPEHGVTMSNGLVWSRGTDCLLYMARTVCSSGTQYNSSFLSLLLQHASLALACPPPFPLPFGLVVVHGPTLHNIYPRKARLE